MIVPVEAPDGGGGHFTGQTGRCRQMPDLLWTPDMSVGCDLLDADHRALLALVRRLDAAVCSHESFEVVASLLTVGVELTRAHVLREERVCRALDRPVEAAHEHAHAAFVAWADGVRTEYAAHRDLGRLRAVMPVIFDWWHQHVCDLDMLDKPFYEDNALRIGRLFGADVLAEPILAQAPLHWPPRPAPVLGLLCRESA